MLFDANMKHTPRKHEYAHDKPWTSCKNRQNADRKCLMYVKKFVILRMCVWWYPELAGNRKESFFFNPSVKSKWGLLRYVSGVQGRRTDILPSLHSRPTKEQLSSNLLQDLQGPEHYKKKTSLKSLFTKWDDTKPCQRRSWAAKTACVMHVDSDPTWERLVIFYDQT